MTNAIAFDKLEVWFRYPRPRAVAGWQRGVRPPWFDS